MAQHSYIKISRTIEAQTQTGIALYLSLNSAFPIKKGPQTTKTQVTMLANGCMPKLATSTVLVTLMVQS